MNFIKGHAFYWIFAFLKTYQKEKNGEKKKLDICQTSFQLPPLPSRQPVPSSPARSS